MPYNVPEVIYDGDNFGDNCWSLLLEISKEKDIAISLSYFPIFEWVEDIQVHIINNNKLVSNFREFNTEHLNIEEKYFDFIV